MIIGIVIKSESIQLWLTSRCCYWIQVVWVNVNEWIVTTCTTTELQLAECWSSAGCLVHQGLGGAATLALCSSFLYLFILLSSSHPSWHHPLPLPALPVVNVHDPPAPTHPLSATAPVSCQVSSLLALSVSQRSDKSEPGVGLSLPLATEVSFPPSIIHILFNLTRWKWPRSVRTSSQANGGEFFTV